MNSFIKLSSRILGISLLAIGLLISGCKKEEGVDPELETINYDGANVTAPSLPAGSYRGAAKFLAASYPELEGGLLESVDYYILEKPTNLFLRIYRSTGNGTPELEYQQNLNNEANESDWNTHILNDPISFGISDLWVAIEFDQGSTLRVLGSDPGPAVPNGEMFYDASVGSWTQLSNAFSNIDINWNIRANIRKP